MDGVLDHGAFSKWRGAAGGDGGEGVGANMTRRECLAVSAAVPAVSAAATEAGGLNSLTAEEKAAGWKLLFDGRSFDGWENPALKSPPGKAWAIEEGCLKATAKPAMIEDLFSQETFGDFELVFGW